MPSEHGGARSSAGRALLHCANPGRAEAATPAPIRSPRPAHRTRPPPPVRRLLDREFVVASSQILHEAMPGDHDPGAEVLLEPTHRSQPRLHGPHLPRLRRPHRDPATTAVSHPHQAWHRGRFRCGLSSGITAAVSTRRYRGRGCPRAARRTRRGCWRSGWCDAMPLVAAPSAPPGRPAPDRW